MVILEASFMADEELTPTDERFFSCRAFPKARKKKQKKQYKSLGEHTSIQVTSNQKNKITVQKNAYHHHKYLSFQQNTS